MPRITVEAVQADGALRRWTLRERIVADNLASDHYADHLIRRLSWAAADAEAIESQSRDFSPADVETAASSLTYDLDEVEASAVV